MNLTHVPSLLLLLMTVHSCTITGQEYGTIPGYRLSAPDEKIILPAPLFEISGITLSDSSSFDCIEDEDGVVFTYDFLQKRITRQTIFWGPGDYEGITRVNDTTYVLRSDGFLFRIVQAGKGDPDVTPIATGIPFSDNEGLCYDRDNNRLLITCKEYSGKGSGSGNRRNIFAYDLRTKELSRKPVYSFRMDDILSAAVSQNPFLRAEAGKKGTKTKDLIRFHPSDIAIHPLTGRLYILSGIDHALAVFSKEGRIENFALLDPALFNQPEGIQFLSNGDMFISNEGGNYRPTLLRFNRRRK